MRGYVYTIEVMLAVAVILFILVLTFSSTAEQPETNIGIIKQSGYDALVYLDQNDLLRQLAQSNDSSRLKTNISALITPSIVFDAAFCSVGCTSAVLPVNRTIVTVDYYISGYRDTYLGKKVRLWMWQLF